MLDLIRPTSGRALVFGVDTTVDPVAIHRRAGYLPGEFVLYDRLTGRPDHRVLREPPGRRRPGLPAGARRATRPRSHRGGSASTRRATSRRSAWSSPSSTGPSCSSSTSRRPASTRSSSRRFYEIIRETRRRGTTIFLSSHILSERSSRPATGWGSSVTGQPHEGRPGRGAPRPGPSPGRDRLRRHVPEAAFVALPGVGDVVVDDHTMRMRVRARSRRSIQAAARYDSLDFVSREPSLEETFLAEYGRGPAEVA